MRKIIVVLIVVFGLNLYAGFNLSDLTNGKKYFKKAERFFNAGNYKQAIPNYLKFLSKKKNKKNVTALYHLSICFMELNDPQDGFKYAQNLYKLKGTKLDYAVLYAEYLVQLKRLKDAIKVYKGIVTIYPEDYLSYIRLGELLVNNGRLKEARSMWLKAVPLKEKPTEAYALLSESYLNVEKNKLMAYYYARKLYDISSPEKKEEIQGMLNEIAGDFKEDFENFYLLKTCKEQAKQYILEKDYKDAFKVLSRCENLNNIDREYLMLFVEVSKKLKKWGKAVDVYTKCLALGFEDGEIYLELGKCYLKLGNKPMAEANFKLALKYDKVKDDALKLLNSI